MKILLISHLLADSLFGIGFHQVAEDDYPFAIFGGVDMPHHVWGNFPLHAGIHYIMHAYLQIAYWLVEAICI
jgi:hypothetical protein